MHALLILAMLGLVAVVATLGLVAPFKFCEQVTDKAGAAPGVTTFQFPLDKRHNTHVIQGTCIKAAGGAGVTSIPVPSDVVGLIQLLVGSSAERTRLASELHGATGLNALCDVNLGGMVRYAQAANANLSLVPVIIGSAADVAQQALLAANTATTAVFQLPIAYCEPYRNTTDQIEAGGLVTGYADGSHVGTVSLAITVPTVANISGHALELCYEYDEMVAPKGSAIMFVKEYRHEEQYAASGNIEVAKQLPNKDGLQRVSLLTVSDPISRVLVKRGSRVLRDLTYDQSVAILTERGYNRAAMIRNRFDIEFDLSGDAGTAPTLDPAQKLSIVATLASANDAGKTITVLSSYFGGLD
jgi:hypothetical protein